MAITICLTLGLVYKQPLRQTQGLMRGIVRLMGLDIPVPDFSTLSRRGRGLNLPVKSRTRRREPVHLVVDSTGLKIFGEGEWLREKA
ncbi:transposase [Roseovarius sp. S1116L3]|uniref:transposase n=1 Tax=Roseovarius roseus TaxID=3342636 RepID=UPI00372C124F